MVQIDSCEDFKDSFIRAVILCRVISNIATNDNVFKSSELEKSFEEIKNSSVYTKSFWESVFNLPTNQKLVLGFMRFDKDSIKMNIPIWIWQCLPDDIIIEGKKKIELEVEDVCEGCVYWQA